MTYLGPISTLPPSAALPPVANPLARAQTTAVEAAVDATHGQPAFSERRRGQRRQQRQLPLLETRQGRDRRKASSPVHIDIEV